VLRRPLLIPPGLVFHLRQFLVFPDLAVAVVYADFDLVV
jgi:hypothetical protein